MNICKVCIVLLGTVLVVTIRAHEFDLNSCETLLPQPKLREITDDHSEDLEHHHLSHVHHNLNDDSHEDDGENLSDNSKEDDLHDLTPGRGIDVPIKVTASVGQYRRHRQLEIDVEGTEFNGFILQARSLLDKTKPIGRFRQVPASVKLLNCHTLEDTAVSKDTGGKTDLKLIWEAPSEDHGNIVFLGTFTQKENYWPLIHSSVITFNHFPPSLKHCGNEKSCYRYSSTTYNCSPEDCDYVVITRITEDNEIEFIIGGKVTMDSGYVGIGYTMDKSKMTYTDISLCVKTRNGVQTQRFLVEEWGKGPLRKNKALENEEIDLDDQSIWCKYRRPLHGPGPDMADLSQSLFQMYLWGEWNETTNEPVLPSASDVTFVTELWNHSSTLSVMHFVGSTGTTVTAVVTHVYVTAVVSSFLRFML